MATNQDPKVDVNLIEQAKRQVNRLAEEIAQLSEMELGPGEYYGEFLQRVLAAIAAPAGAVWVRTNQGNLQLQYQIRMREVGIEAVENGREIHGELLRQVVMKGQRAMLMPQSGLGASADGKAAPGNPTNYVCLLAPILVEKQVAGLVEVWQDPNRGQDAQRGFLQFMVRMAALAANYTRNHQLRQMSSQQQVWTQLESFTRNLHTSLNTTEVAYHIANEGRRLVECDRISIAVREGGRAVVRAISGSDMMEKRSNLVVLMRKLFDAVIEWDEKLVYSGQKDETLPPKVLKSLDEYLEESNSKLLVVQPLRDEREKESKKPPRSAVMMECFEPEISPEQLTARMDVVAKHATSALYNAAEYRQIPFRWVWLPMAKVQEGLGGKTKAIIALVTFAVVSLIMALILVPYPLKLEANGSLVPKERRWVYAPEQGIIVGFAKNVKPGARVIKGQRLIKLYSPDLWRKLQTVETEIQTAKLKLNTLRAIKEPGQPNPDTILAIQEAQTTLKFKEEERRDLKRHVNADASTKAGEFWVLAPMNGLILTSDFREKLHKRHVTPSDPLLRIGDAQKVNQNPKKWEAELKISQKHIGQVLAAFKNLEDRERAKAKELHKKLISASIDEQTIANLTKDDPTDARLARYSITDEEQIAMLKDLARAYRKLAQHDFEVDVDFLLISQPTTTYKGKLHRGHIAPEATPDRTDNNEADPVVIARVRLSGDDIPEGYRLPPHLLLTGTEVHSRVRCGYYPMGYSLFYGVWEFFYEKVVFFF
ncbi:MAG: hypothetical protein ACFCD0_17505 [Gemmataceae bacterium]